MRNISIFARPAYLRLANITSIPYLKRGSSLIRGEQIAEYLGARFNPAADYENDVCIYVKPLAFEEIKEGSYIDILEAVGLTKILFNYPKLGIIVISQAACEYLKNNQYKNNIVVIPQHHCNFERFIRDRKEITTVGVIGSKDSFEYPIDEFRERLGKIGLKFTTNHSFKNRQDVIDFYKQIDIQVSWNIDTRRKILRQKLFQDPLRMKNAASFGIPTVAFPEINYKEFEENYISVNSTDLMISEIEKLKNKDYYEQWSSKIIKEAEKYHISKIAKKYKQLL